MARILVMDDDRAVLTFMKDYLSIEHSVELVATGHDAWKKLSSEDYDLLVLDWDMPDINGVDILRKFRQAGGTTPILMLTGRQSVDDKETGLEDGADDYLTKPFHMKKLRALLKALLRSRQSVKTPTTLREGNEQVLRKADL